MSKNNLGSAWNSQTEVFSVQYLTPLNPLSARPSVRPSVCPAKSPLGLHATLNNSQGSKLLYIYILNVFFLSGKSDASGPRSSFPFSSCWPTLWSREMKMTTRPVASPEYVLLLQVLPAASPGVMEMNNQHAAGCGGCVQYLTCLSFFYWDTWGKQ